MTPNTNTANTSRGSERPAIPSVPTISSTTMPTPTYTHTYTPYFVSSRTFNRHPNPNSGPNSMVYGDLNLNLNDHPNSFNSNLSSSSTSISGLSRVDSSWAYPYSYNSNSVPHLYRADERKLGMKDMDVGNNSKSSTSGQEGYSQVVQATPSTRPRARKRAFHSSMDVDNDRNNTNITTNRKRTRGEHDYDGDAADTRPTARLSRHVSQSTAGPSSKADTVPVERIPKTPVPIRNPNSNPKLPSRTTKLKPSNPNLHVRASRTTEDLQPNEALTAVKPALYSHQPEVPKVIPVSDMGNDTRFRGRGRGTGGGLRFRGGRKISNHWNQHRRSKQARMGTSNRDGFFGNDSTPSTAASSGSSMPTRPTPPTPHRLPSAVINKILINNQPATNSLSVSDHDTEQRPRRDFTHLLPTKIRNRNMKRKTVDESEESGEVQVGEHEPGNAEGGVEDIIGNERVKSEPADVRLSPSESPTTTSRDPTQAPVFSQPHIKSEPPDLDVIPSSSTPDANQTSGTKRYHPIPAACLKHISASDKIVPNPHFRTARAEFSRRAVDELQREGLKVMRILWRPDGMCVDWERRKSVGGDAKPSLGSVRNIGKGKQKEILETERNENLIDQLAAARGAILYSMEDEDEPVLVQNESSPPQTAISSHSPDVAPLAQESPSSSPPCTAIPSPAQKQVEPRPPQLIDSEHNVNPHTGIDEVNLLLQSFEVLRRTLMAIKNESSPIHNDSSSLTTADPPLHSLPSSPPVLAIPPPASRPSPTPSPSPMKLQESNFDFSTRGDADMIIDLTQDDEPARIDSTASYAHPRPPDNSPPADDDSQPRSRYDPPLLVRLGSGSRSVGPSSLRPQTQTQNIQETHGQSASCAFTNSSSLISSYLDNAASENKITHMSTPSPPHLSDPRLDTAGPSSRDSHSHSPLESKLKFFPMPHPLTPTHTPPPPTSMFDFHDTSTVVIVGDIEDETGNGDLTASYPNEDKIGRETSKTGRKKSGTSTWGKRGAMVTRLQRPPQLKDEAQSRENQTRMGDSDPLDVCQAIDEDGDIGHPPVQPSDGDFRSSSYERNSSSPIQSIGFVDPSANNSNVQPIARGKEVVDQSRNQIEMNEVASGMKGYDVNVENDVEGEMEADSMDEKSEMEALAVEFLRRYINAWEYNRHSLVNAYAPSAVFSCSVIVPNTIPSTSFSSNSRASPSDSSSRSTPNLSPTLEFASHFVTSTALSSSFPSSSSSGIYSTSRTLNRPPLLIQTPAVISPALLLLDPQRLYTFFPRGEKAEIAYDSLWLGEAGAGGGLVYLGVQAELDRQTRTLANVNMNGEKVCISWNFVLRRTFMDDIEHGGGSGNAQGSEDDEIQFPLLVVSHQMVVRDTC